MGRMMQDRTEETGKPVLKRKLRLAGMRRRWIVSSVFPVITILLLIAALATVILVANYYSNARSALENKARARRELFQHLCDGQLQRVLPQRGALRHGF